MATHRYKLIATVSAIAIFALSNGAEAIAQSMDIEEIIVTARRRAEPLQKIPVSITAFTDIQIERGGIRNIDDVAKLTPGLTYDYGFSPQDTRPSIRGLPATRGRPPVGILVDGIDVSSEAIQTGGGGSLMNMRLVDVERIEVVKGPQSALYGRAAFGGAINYITKKPSDTFSANAFVDVGDYGQAEVRVGAGGPVDQDGNVGFRLNAAYAQHNGFHRNAVSGAKIGGFESVGVSGLLAADVSENLKATLRVAYSEDEGEPRPEIYLGGVNFLPAPANPLNLTGGFNPAYGRLAIKNTDRVLLSLDPFTGKDFEGTTLDAMISSLNVEWKASNNITFTSLTGYNDADATESIDSDKFGAPYTNVTLPPPGGRNEPLARLSANGFSTDTRQLSQEFRLSDLESEGFRWAIGGLYWDEKVDQRDNSYFVVDFADAGSAGLNAALIGRRGLNEATLLRDLEHWSGYGLAEFDVTEKITVTAEARYSDDSYVYDIDGSTNFAFGVFFGGPVPFTTPPQIPIARASDSYFTPRVSIDYEVNNDILLYASAAKGAKPGGFSTLSIGATLDTARFKPEKLWSYELGAKTQFADGRVQLNGALFYMDYTDKQETTQDAAGGQGLGLRSIVRNAGKAEIKGLEADVAFAISKQLTLTGSYTHLDTKYTNFTFATLSANDITRAGNCRTISIAGNTACEVSLTGNQLERQPKHAFTIGANASIPISGTLNAIAEVSAQYEGKRFLAQWNRWTLPSYTNVDARLGVETEGWTIIGYAENLFNSKQIRSGQENFDLFSFGTSINLFVPDKRQLGMRFSYRM